jgi:hypothetical protein
MMRPSWRLNKTLHYSDGLETIAVFPIASGCQAEEPALIVSLRAFSATPFHAGFYPTPIKTAIEGNASQMPGGLPN